jgi:hypothetical protein
MAFQDTKIGKKYHTQWLKNFRLKNRKIVNIWAKNWRLKNRDKFLLTNYKTKDHQKNLKCDLTLKWLQKHITSQPCIYCGETKNIGCDRISNKKGHTKNNVIPCCKICNYVRNNFFSVSEMKKIGKTIRKIKNERGFL